ncbi:MAG: hypothetical protein DLM58_02225 [Pseudonocardiales bacterium]|nr:MAG: hypothetical protein DLM58_02225 [Pseudonocardiales bacterium]
MDLGELTLATFEPLVGDQFTIAAESPIELVLSTARSAGEWPGGRAPFTLTFRGPAHPLLPQAIYRLEHADLGLLEIFIVPSGQDADSTTYEAIFT